MGRWLGVWTATGPHAHTFDLSVDPIEVASPASDFMTEGDIVRMLYCAFREGFNVPDSTLLEYTIL